jgi:hypothetical protein
MVIPSLVETFNRVTRRVPHVEQELHILPGHPSFSAIKKLCSFSWTFPENSRRPGENPSKQNDILVVVKVTLIYFTFWLVGPFTACYMVWGSPLRWTIR